MKTINVTLTFTEEVLGTASADPKIHSDFIASKAPDAKTIEEEIAAMALWSTDQQRKGKAKK